MSTLRGERINAAYAGFGAEKRWLRYTVVTLLLLTAVGAVGGGVEMIRNPTTAFGTTTELIAGTPFSTFTWPGVLLLVLVGLVPTAIAVAMLIRVPGAIAVAAAWGVGMMAWIITQWFLLSDFLWLQPVFFVVGAVVTGLCVYALRREMR